ncbi:MAG TPA: ketoacyl-ACP synthase III [Candidatus Scatomonas merdavium]|nr:ketoacyl-ACP synthase III [Candidatus Scatomonas merdavium]
MTGKIYGTGSCVPVKAVSNDDLAKIVETNDEWIRERTGIARRHIISGEESTVSLAAEASRRALEMAGIKAEELDMILFATITSNVVLPSASCSVQGLIGADNAVCFDLGAACSGFVFAYSTAQAFIQTGMYRTILVIGADCLSELTNWKDRSSCILFGDAAGAVVLRAEENIPYESVMHSDGGMGWTMTCNSRNRTVCPPVETTYMQMDGKEIFKFAATRVPAVIHELLEKISMTADDIDLFILHQANGRIIEAIAKRMKQDISKFPMNVEEYGNSSSGTVPLVLDQLNRSGKLHKGQKLILCGYGAGLSWGAAYVEWQG